MFDRGLPTSLCFLSHPGVTEGQGDIDEDMLWSRQSPFQPAGIVIVGASIPKRLLKACTFRQLVLPRRELSFRKNAHTSTEPWSTDTLLVNAVG